MKILLVNLQNFLIFIYHFLNCDFVNEIIFFKPRFIFDQLVGASYRPNQIPYWTCLDLFQIDLVKNFDEIFAQFFGKSLWNRSYCGHYHLCPIPNEKLFCNASLIFRHNSYWPLLDLFHLVWKFFGAFLGLGFWHPQTSADIRAYGTHLFVDINYLDLKFMKILAINLPET